MTSDWQERALAGAREQDAERSAMSRMGANLKQDQKTLVQRAAAARNMNVTSYLTRAAMAMVCNDLGLDWDTVMKDEGSIRRPGESGNYRPEPARGRGFGKWRITGVR